MVATQVLRVHRFDPASSTAKQKQIIQLDKSIAQKSLADVRKILIENHVFDSKDFKSPFCEKNGSDVGDDMAMELYLELLGIKSMSNDRLDVYFKTKKTFMPMDKATQDFIKEKLDLAFQEKPELIKANPELLTSSFSPSDWVARKGDISHAADLTEREWSSIIRTNCLLSGHRILTSSYRLDGKKDKVILDGVERSPYNAFKLKPRIFEAYEISSSDPEDDESHFNGEQYYFRVPRFRVDDDSCVTVFEVKTGFEKSLANSSFSETSFQVAGGGGAWGWSAGLKLGGSTGSSSDSSSIGAQAEESLVVTYNFPRVSLYWDSKSLEVTQECLSDIQTVVDAQTLNVFHEKYGHIFSRRAQLGGRLSSSRKVTSTEKSSKEEQSRKLKASAAASISSSFAEASMSSSHERQSRTGKESSTKSLNNSVAWEATGGDTLLCNNPAEWCATVGNHGNWRIVNQDEIIPLYKFLVQFLEVGEGIVERFEKSANNTYGQGENGEPLKNQFQMFELVDLETGRLITVSNGDDSIIQKIKNLNACPSMQRNLMMANASDAKASVVLGSKKDSNPASSRFVASKLFAPGEKVELKYGELLHAKSVIHPKHWHLSPCISLHIPTKFGLVWLHLNSLEGCGIYLHNANEPESRDSVEDGDVVYITSGARTNYKSPQLVGKLTEENLLEADYTWRHGEDQPSVPGRKFRFRKTGIYEGESALR